MERDTRQAYPHQYYSQHYASPYNYHPLQAAFNEPNSYQAPYVPSYYQKDQVAERQIFLITVTSTSAIATYKVVTSSPSCYDANAKLPQCPA